MTYSVPQGFSVDGQENIQEILSKQLYLCQFLVALLIVREGKHFFIYLVFTINIFISIWFVMMKL